MSFVLPRIMAWSYSRLKTWENCPFQAKLKFIQRLKEPDSMYAARGSELHKQAEGFIKDPNQTLPPALAGVAKFLEPFRGAADAPRTEWQAALTKDWKPTKWFDPDVYLRVIFDLWAKTQAQVKIRDHKTGKIREEEHADQLDLYATSAFGLDETVDEVEVGIIYIDHNKETTKSYTRTMFRERRQFWDDRAGKMLSDDIFAPRPGQSCRYCHFRKTNGGPCQFG